MNLSNTIATAVLAGAIALTGAQGAFAGAETANSSETNSGHAITRTQRSQAKELRGEGEWSWMNYGTYDLLMATRIDMGSTSAAEFGVEMMVDGGILEDSGFTVDGTFRVRGIEGCEGVNVSMDGLDAYVVVCQDGEFVHMVVSTNKQDALDTAQAMQDGYEPEAPRGYEVFEGGA